MRPARLFTLAIAAAALLSGSAHAETLTFWKGNPDGNTIATNDTYIKSGDSTPYGNEQWVPTGPTGTIGLLSFPNLFGSGLLPVGAVIDKVTLDLCAQPVGTQVQMFVATSAWTENTVWSGSKFGNGGVSTGAKIVDATISSSASWHQQFDITETFKAWYDGSLDNYGLVIKTKSGSTYKFASSEHPNFANAIINERPALTIEYHVPPPPSQVVPEPASMALLGIGGLFAARMFRRRNGPNTPAVA